MVGCLLFLVGFIGVIMFFWEIFLLVIGSFSFRWHLFLLSIILFIGSIVISIWYDKNNVKICVGQKSKVKQTEKQKIEVIKNEEILKKIFIDNSIEITLLGINLCTLHELTKKCANKLNVNVFIDENIFYQNFMDIYLLTKDVKNLREFDLKTNKYALKKIFIKNYKGYIKKSNLDIDNIGKGVVKKDIIYNMLQESLYMGKETFNFVFKDTMDTLNYMEDMKTLNYANSKMWAQERLEKCKILICWILLLYAEIFNRFLLILKNKYRFINNKELYNITINLYNEKSKDFDNEKDIYFSAGEKLFTIYQSFYLDTFDEELEKIEFMILSYLIYKGYKYKELNIEDSIIKVLDSYNLIPLLKEDEGNLSSIDNILFKIGENFIDSENDFKELYWGLINMYIEKMSVQELITMYLQFIIKIDKVKETKKLHELEKEKNRYLNNDFIKEEEIREDKIEFENITTATEFELYLKQLYIRLGYIVELTKTTGDQGADLILYKDGLKTVVQAKFYSSKVGNKAVQEVVGAIKFYDADYGIVVTNNLFTKSAIELAEVNNIELIDKSRLDELREQTYND